MSANDLKALKSAITGFTDVQPKPRQGRAASAAATSELAGLFEQLDATLNEQLDPLLEKFQFTSLSFHTAYQTARSIVDSAATREAKAAESAVTLPKAA